MRTLIRLGIIRPLQKKLSEYGGFALVKNGYKLYKCFKLVANLNMIGLAQDLTRDLIWRLIRWPNTNETILATVADAVTARCLVQ